MANNSCSIHRVSQSLCSEISPILVDWSPVEGIEQGALWAALKEADTPLQRYKLYIDLSAMELETKTEYILTLS